MKPVLVTHHYVESGLPYVYLVGVETRNCESCGEATVSIPRMEELHLVIARIVAHKIPRLIPEEVRFLRKVLGLSGKDFASYLAVTPETVSRWESTKKPEPMSQAADKLLRVMVFNQPPREDYDSIQLRDFATDSPEPMDRVEVESSDHGWNLARA